MMFKSKILIIIFCILLCLIVMYKFGRSIWHPFYLKVRGKRTLSDVYKKIGKSAEKKLNTYFQLAKVAYPPESLTLIALKDEKLLEVWSTTDSCNTLIHKYKFTGYSGSLGPKLKSGDRQIPEGLYSLEYLNPNSSYHLSMKIDYPNEFDKLAAKEAGRTNLGGDIFIHGKSVSIGCIPLGDSNIEELFTLVYRTGIKNVKVIIAPNDLRDYKPKYDDEQLKWLNDKYSRIMKSLMNYKTAKN